MKHPVAGRTRRGCDPGWRVAGFACLALLVAACPRPDEPQKPDKPDEQRAELGTGSVEPKQTSGAPYPPAEPDERIPNMGEEERWEPVPDGPPRGEMEPANDEVGIKEAEIERDPGKPRTGGGGS